MQGYPPYKIISWDLASWEYLRPCVSFSNGNRTATFRAAKEFTKLQRIKLKCIVHNRLDMLTGTRTVDPHSLIDNGVRDLFAEPLQMQTAGPVERNPFGNASFVCAAKSYDVYRVCKVEYTTLTLVQRCAASGLAASATCCTVDRYHSPKYSSGLQAQVLSVEHDTIYVMNVTTSLLGHFQCQVYNYLVQGFQSIGDPIHVVLPQNSTEDTTPSVPNMDTPPSASITNTTPSAPNTDTPPSASITNTTPSASNTDTPSSVPNTYMYLFLVSVSMIAVLLVVLAVVAVVVGVVCCRARKKCWSTSGTEGRTFLQLSSICSSMESSTGATLGHVVEQCMHGEGSRQLEGGRAGTEPVSVRSRPHQGSLCCHSFPLVHDGRHCLIMVLWPWQNLPWILWPVADHTDSKHFPAFFPAVGQTPIHPNPPLGQDDHSLNNGAISLQTIGWL